MKIFIFSLILFALLICSLVFNYIYVNRVTDRLCSLILALPSVDSPDCSARVDELYESWQSAKRVLGISLGVNETDAIEDLLVSLKIYADTNSAVYFENTCALLVNRFRTIATFESFSVENIF